MFIAGRVHLSAAGIAGSVGTVNRGNHLSLLTQLPSWVAAGEATVELFGSIKAMVQDDRSLTADERAKIEALIDEKMAIVNDTSRDVVSVTINGEQRDVPKRATYEQLVEIAGRTGNPSMTVSFGDRGRAGRAPHAGDEIELDDRANITVVHTGNA